MGLGSVEQRSLHIDQREIVRAALYARKILLTIRQSFRELKGGRV